MTWKSLANILIIVWCVKRDVAFLQHPKKNISETGSRSAAPARVVRREARSRRSARSLPERNPPPPRTLASGLDVRQEGIGRGEFRLVVCQRGHPHLGKRHRSVQLEVKVILMYCRLE